ncbi:hypothetical protein TWF173_007892 [Orbilia oligospora]|nr:hypothetical protein TWF173_007892 [Orbilia oligospora]
MDGLTWLLGAKKEPSYRALPNTATVSEAFDNGSIERNSDGKKDGKVMIKKGLAYEFCSNKLDQVADGTGISFFFRRSVVDFRSYRQELPSRLSIDIEGIQNEVRKVNM